MLLELLLLSFSFENVVFNVSLLSLSNRMDVSKPSVMLLTQKDSPMFLFFPILLNMHQHTTVHSVMHLILTLALAIKRLTNKTLPMDARHLSRLH